ncbi:hypothetical protein VTO73DRAFT_3718 [Trametes versicolor]
MSRGGFIGQACLSVKDANIDCSGSDHLPFIKPSNETSSDDASIDTPHISNGSFGPHTHDDSCHRIYFDCLDWWKRTIVYGEHIFHPKGWWHGNARLLRIALQYPFPSRRKDTIWASHLWLSIDISETHCPYASRTTESGPDGASSEPEPDADVCEDRTSTEYHYVAPSSDSTGLSVTTRNGDTQNSSQDSIEILRQENDAQPVHTTATTQGTTGLPSEISTTTPLSQIPTPGNACRDTSPGLSGSNEGPTHSEPTRPMDGPGHRGHESLGDTGEQSAEDGCEGPSCRLENASLRAEIEQQKRKNAELSSELAAVSSQVAAMFARLDALTTSPAVNIG